MTKQVFDRTTLLTSGEVSKQLGVSLRSVVNWTEAGRMPALRTPGGHRRYKLADVQKFLADLKQADAKAKSEAESASAQSTAPAKPEKSAGLQPGSSVFDLLRHDTSLSFHRLSTTTGVLGRIAGRDDPATVVFEHGGFEYTVTVSRTLLQPVTK